MLSEHHRSDDGYLPSPLPVAGAFAAVTSRIPIAVSALLANLDEPVRLAEDLAVLDRLRQGPDQLHDRARLPRGRLRPHGRPWATRGRDIEARIEELLRLWREVAVTPAPYSSPHPVVFYGGGTPAASSPATRRAAGCPPSPSWTEPAADHRDGDAGGAGLTRQRSWLPEIARAMTSRWISEVPSKIV